ncbi:MAG: preprotein translocase subunit YajC [Propionibacteriales bacterium]|nr:preprotein translocase subunit YajC [Propionibacteriales bacterium]
MDPNTLTTIAMIALMVVAFYFLILRPQRKRQAAQAKTLESLTPGSRVLTSTGIYGNLVRLGDKQAVIELSPGTEMTMVKHAIVRVVQPGEEDLESEGVRTLDDDDLESDDKVPAGALADPADDRALTDRESDDRAVGSSAAATSSSSTWQEFDVADEKATGAGTTATASEYPSYAPKESTADESAVSDTGSAAPDAKVTDTNVTETELPEGDARDTDGTKRI